MEADPRRWIGALRRSHDDLAAFVADLTVDDLERPSACTEWNVAQVLSHLGSGAEIGNGNLEAAVAGRHPPARESFPAVWERWNRLGPNAIAASFVDADELLVSAFEGLDGDARAGLRVPLPFLPEPIDVAGLAGFRLSEHALHSWDVYSSFDPTATVAPYATDLPAEALLRLTAGRLTPPHTPTAVAVSGPLSLDDLRHVFPGF